jgi:hypothetical protein
MENSSPAITPCTKLLTATQRLSSKRASSIRFASIITSIWAMRGCACCGRVRPAPNRRLRRSRGRSAGRCGGAGARVCRRAWKAKRCACPVEGFKGGDRVDIGLPAEQQKLMEEIVALGKPVVLVLLNGSALAVNWARDHVPAIVEAWYPGEAGGDAIADVLFGDYNPAGRLPVTFYRSADQLPPSPITAWRAEPIVTLPASRSIRSATGSATRALPIAICACPARRALARPSRRHQFREALAPFDQHQASRRRFSSRPSVATSRALRPGDTDPRGT